MLKGYDRTIQLTARRSNNYVSYVPHSGCNIQKEAHCVGEQHG